MGYLTLDPYQSGCKLKGAIWTGQLVWKRITGNFQWPLGNVVADVGGDWRPRQGTLEFSACWSPDPKKWSQSGSLFAHKQANMGHVETKQCTPCASFCTGNFSLWMATNPRPSCDGKKPEVSHDHKPFTGAPQHWRLHVRGLYSDDEVLTRQHEDVSNKKKFSTSQKNAVTSGGYRMYVHVAIPYLSSRDTWQHTWNVATEVRPWWSRNKVSTLFSVKHIYMYIYIINIVSTHV